MDAVVLIAAGADDPAKGWAGPVALAIGALVCYGIWRFDMWQQDRRDPSPTEPGAPLPRETPQVRAVSSHVSPRVSPDETAKQDWWGTIRNVNGSLRRVWYKAGHIAQTGDSPPPDDTIPDDEDPDDEENEFDLPLDDFEGDDDADHEGDDDNGEVPVVAASMETREDYVSRCIEAGVPKPKIVAALQEHYGLSRATAYRVVDVAAERRPAA